jgi:hypothetical protein
MASPISGTSEIIILKNMSKSFYLKALSTYVFFNLSDSS